MAKKEKSIKIEKTTKIQFCGCEQPWQDEKYGNHMRVHNLANEAYTCTGCGTRKKV